MTKVDQAYQEYHDALHDLHVAQHNFDHADPEYVDIAIHQLQAAELRVGVALREVKSVEGGDRIVGP